MRVTQMEYLLSINSRKGFKKQPGLSKRPKRDFINFTTKMLLNFAAVLWATRATGREEDEEPQQEAAVSWDEDLSTHRQVNGLCSGRFEGSLMSQTQFGSSPFWTTVRALWEGGEQDPEVALCPDSDIFRGHSGSAVYAHLGRHLGLLEEAAMLFALTFNENAAAKIPWETHPSPQTSFSRSFRCSVSRNLIEGTRALPKRATEKYEEIHKDRMRSWDWLFPLAIATVAVAEQHGGEASAVHKGCFMDTILDGRVSPKYEAPVGHIAELLLQNVYGVRGTSRIYLGEECAMHVLHNGKTKWDQSCYAYATNEETVTIKLSKNEEGIVMQTSGHTVTMPRRGKASADAGVTVRPFGLIVNTLYNCLDDCRQVQGSVIPLHLHMNISTTLFLRPVSLQERIIFEVKNTDHEWDTAVFELPESEDHERNQNLMNTKTWFSINISVSIYSGGNELTATPSWNAGASKMFTVLSEITVIDFRLSRNVIWSVGCVPTLGSGQPGGERAEVSDWSGVLILLALVAAASISTGLAVWACLRKRAAEGHTHPTSSGSPQGTTACNGRQSGTLSDHTYESVDDFLFPDVSLSENSAEPAIPSRPPTGTQKNPRAGSHRLLPVAKGPPDFKTELNEFYVSTDLQGARRGTDDNNGGRIRERHTEVGSFNGSGSGERD
ncbi:uncharacterized protein LOC122249446 [Penaeus japonicus]|uniref:uncharacterized protein LOC122249446 n=1 Tax=Penaeus japonicus TaxID=27405 RepID=UPI001C717691|nr:uncharacterized protein LOC122249446 [Penaeus japonicus]